jgi:hypothetical protein
MKYSINRTRSNNKQVQPVLDVLQNHYVNMQMDRLDIVNAEITDFDGNNHDARYIDGMYTNSASIQRAVQSYPSLNNSQNPVDFGYQMYILEIDNAIQK